MNITVHGHLLAKKDIAPPQGSSVEKRLHMAASSLAGSLSSAAIATTVSRMAQLSRGDKKILWDCLKDFATAKTQEDFEDTMQTILEILDTEEPQTNLVSFEDLQKNKSKESYDVWLFWISGKIKELRKGNGLTQEQLAELSGLPQSHISRLERRVHSPSRNTIEKLAKALGVDVGVFDPVE